MLTGPNPERALTLLYKTGLLEEILPEVIFLQKQAHDFEKNAYEYMLKIVKSGAPFTSLEEAFAIIFQDLNCKNTKTTQEILKKMGKRLRLSQKTIETYIHLILNKKNFEKIFDMNLADLKRFLRIANFENLLAIYKLDCQQKNKELKIYEYSREMLKMYKSVLFPTPLLSGKELIQWGYEPGPIFQEILEYAEYLQLEEIVEKAEDMKASILKKYKLSASQEVL